MKMKYTRVIVLLMVVGYSAMASGMAGTNLWDVVAVGGAALNAAQDIGFNEVLQSSSVVDGIYVQIQSMASCSDYMVDSALLGAQSEIDMVVTGIGQSNSLLDVVIQTDVPRIASKVDGAASEIDQGVHHNFVSVWDSLHTSESLISAIESKLEVVASESDGVISSIDAFSSADFSTVDSVLDVALSDADVAASLCDTLYANQVVPLVSYVDGLASGVDVAASILDTFVQTSFANITTQMSSLEGLVSSVDVATQYNDSSLDQVASHIDDILKGGPCGGVPITQSAMDAAGGTITIGVTPGFTVAGLYCLAQEVTGTVLIDMSNVTLNLNGHTLSGSIGFLNSTRSHVDIANGRIVNSGNCLSLLGSHIVIDGVEISYDGFSSDACIQIGASGGSEIASDIVVSRCICKSGVFSGVGITINETSSAVQILETSFLNLGTGVRMNASSGSIKGVVINDASFVNLFSGGAIVIDTDNVSEVTISDVTISNSLYGILATATTQGATHTIRVRNCSINGGSLEGISATSVDNLQIAHVTIMNRTGAAVALSNTTNFMVSDCSLVNNVNGITMSDCSYGDIAHNRIESNGTNGILLNINVIDVAIQYNDVINHTVNIAWNDGIASIYNTIIGNKAYTTSAVGTGNNYTDMVVIPTVEWQRSTNTATVISGGAAVTGWHNWSSIA